MHHLNSFLVVEDVLDPPMLLELVAGVLRHIVQVINLQRDLILLDVSLTVIIFDFIHVVLDVSLVYLEKRRGIAIQLLDGLQRLRDPITISHS